MSSDLLTAAIGAGAGLVSGSIASLIAPWVHWGIEKRRKKLEHRISLVKSWEAMIAGVVAGTWGRPVNYTGASWGSLLLQEPEFSSLKPYLSRGTLESLFRVYLVEATIGWAEPVWLRKVQEDIQAVKAKWNLE